METTTNTTEVAPVAVPTDKQAKAIRDLTRAGYGHAGDVLQPGYNPHQQPLIARLEMLAAAGLLVAEESGKLRRFTVTEGTRAAFRAWCERRQENPANRGRLPSWA